MANEPKRIPIEAQMILEKLESDILISFSQLSDSKLYETLVYFCRRYAETKKNQILDLQTENERKFANDVATIKGSIYAMGILLDVIKGSQKELSKRKE